MWHWQQGLHRKGRLTAWAFCIFLGISISVILFDLMPSLIEKEPKLACFSECISPVSVIRIKRPKPTAAVRKKGEIKKPDRAKLFVSKIVPVIPKLSYENQLDIPFKVNPPLPPVYTKFSVQPVIDVRPSSFGIKGAFAIGEVDSPPIPVVRIPPVYPVAARMEGIEGWVVVRFVVDENGRVTDVQVVKSKPKGIFESAVVKCVSQWRFKPATLEGVKVRTLVQTKILLS